MSRHVTYRVIYLGKHACVQGGEAMRHVALDGRIAALGGA